MAHNSDVTPPIALPTFPSFRHWHPILDECAVRIMIAIVSLLAAFGLFFDWNEPTTLIPFLIVTVPAVTFIAYKLDIVYRWHVAVWKRLTITDLVLPVIGYLMLGLIWGIVGGGFGLFNLFWHDKGWISLLAGAGAGTFWAVFGYLAYLLYTNDLYSRSRRPDLLEADGGLLRWCRKRFNDFAAFFGYPRAADLDVEPLQQGKDRKQAISDFLASPHMEQERRKLIVGLLAPLVALSFIPVIYSTSEKQNRHQWTSYEDGFCRMAQTIYDRGYFALGMIVPMAIFALLLRIDLKPGRYRLTRLPIKLWNQLVSWIDRRWIAAPRLGEGLWLKISVACFWLGLVSFLCSGMLGVTFLIDRSGGNLPTLAAFGMYIGVMCFLAWRWCNPVGKQKVEPDETEREKSMRVNEWDLRIRTRNMFFAWGLVFMGGYFFNHLNDVRELVPVTPAAVSIAMLLIALTVVYGWLRLYRRGAATLTLILLIVIHGFSSRIQNYPHRLEGLEAYYAKDSRTVRDGEDPLNSKPSLYHYDDLRKRDIPDNESHLKTLNNYEVLKKWNIFVRGEAFQGRSSVSGISTQLLAPKPPLIIVTTSGGASNSAIFTLNMLLELELIHPGITRHIRVVCGASGGMFGAAYYRTQIDTIRKRQADYFNARIDRTKTPDDMQFDELRKNISQDFLSSIAQEWAFKDMAMGFCPFPYKHDRGLALEKSWKHHLGAGIFTKFSQLKKDEANGTHPSLIFSPVLVEDGRQLLISTLDLDPITRPELNFNDADDYVQKIRAVEFFKLFPKATDFKLSTATRLNCTFPFVSPSASLPTTPPRRAVDAGYYDNHGMNVAVSWAYEHRAWLQENTSEVIILQFRPWYWVFEKDMPSDQAFANGRRFDRPITDAEREKIDREGSINWFWSKPPLSFDEYTTPLQGGMSALRSSMIFRNSQQLRLLQNALPESKDKTFRGVRSYTFVGNLGSSMSWYLPRHLVLEIEAVIRKADDPNWKPQNGENEWYKDQPNFQAAVRWNQKQFDDLKADPAVNAYFPKVK